jgi:hypothetical protein
VAGGGVARFTLQRSRKGACKHLFAAVSLAAYDIRVPHLILFYTALKVLYNFFMTYDIRKIHKLHLRL